ncbi:MAG: hypothetical protein ACRCVJ_18710 [Clostridium sp.]|uniref:hypothetical protein n=1 Tax=Clostridium sp. TaxID=1506 RepID=UPI003F3839F5
MELKIGQELILKKDLPLVNVKQGEIMKVHKTDNSNVMLKHNLHCGVFSHDEIKEYFDIYNPTSEYADIDKYIVNENVVVVILSSGVKGVAKCMPEDIFNKKTGIRIAYVKAKIKEYKKELKKY